MAKLTVDGREVEVANNASILEAARKLDINVPTYCWDPRMKPYGACRLCMVEANGRLVASCCTTVRDGMAVLTATPEALKSRREMVAYLLIHHPLDCPYCDKSGDCELQQRTYEFGIGEVPVRDEKITVPVNFQHPVVEPFLTRCIVCGKCVRACDEVRGEGAIEMVNRGFETVVDTAYGQALECTSCGECIEVCPVGALTSKVFKFKNRAWQMQKTHTTCNYCSVGCTMDVEHFKGEVKRVRAHPGYGHNDGFLCALGRFGYDFVHHPDRVTVPYVKRTEGGGLELASWEEALDTAATLLADAARRDPKAVAVIGSRRIGNEDAFVLQKFARGVLGTANVDSSARTADWPVLRAIRAAGLQPVDDLNAAVRTAEVIVVVGDASQAADVASVKMQNMARFNGATLIQLNPSRTQLSKFAQIDLRVKPAQEAAALTALAQRVGALTSASPTALGEELKIAGSLPEAQTGHGVPDEALEAAAKAIAGAKTALFAVCSGHWLSGRAEAVGAALANLALASGKVAGEGSGVVYFPEKNNSLGSMEAGLLSDRLPGLKDAPAGGLTIDQMLAEGSGIQAAYVVGENIYDRLPNLPALIVQDILMSETATRADVLFPASSYVERQGTFTNFEGTIQWFNRAIPPVGQSRADWQITAELARRVAEKLGKDAKPFDYRTVVDVTAEFEKAIGREVPPAPILPTGMGNPAGHHLAEAIATAQEITAPETPLGAQGDSRFASRPGEGATAAGEEQTAYAYQPVEAVPAASGSPDYPLLLISGPQRWVNGTTSRYADGLLGLYPLAKVELSPVDAAQLGIEDGDDVHVASASGGVLMKAEVSLNMPRGVAMIPGYVQPAIVISEGEAIGRLFGANTGAVAVKIEKREARELGFAGFNEQVAVA